MLREFGGAKYFYRLSRQINYLLNYVYKIFITKLCIMIIFIHIATFVRSTDVLRTLLNTQPRNGTDAVLAAIAQGCAFGSVGEMHR